MLRAILMETRTGYQTFLELEFIDYCGPRRTQRIELVSMQEQYVLSFTALNICFLIILYFLVCLQNSKTPYDFFMYPGSD